MRRQVGIRKSIAVDASLLNQVASEPGVTFWPGRSLAGAPIIGQMVSGVEATRAWSAAFAWNVGRPVPTLPLLVGRGEGALQAEAPRGVEYRRGTVAGGPVRSSDEGPVMGLERRGRITRSSFVRSTGPWVWEELRERAQIAGQAV